MKKRRLSILLSIVMLFSLLPTTAFAASYAKISVNDILLGDNYYLKSNSARAPTIQIRSHRAMSHGIRMAF